MNHNNAEKKEIELGEIKPVKPEEENTTVRRPISSIVKIM